MCGLLGASWRDSHSDLSKALKTGLELLAHRGPNDAGLDIKRANGATVALGHTRLSIIDLSQGGHQPMLSEDSRFALIFNGEIYNYRELRTELTLKGRKFRTESDTEVLLQGLIHWGEAAPDKLKGMFAFVLHDRQLNTLLCVRDAFGIKPFFYTQTSDGAFMFSSELPALLKVRGDTPAASWQRSYDYLLFGDYDNREESFIEGVRHLPPGCLLKFQVESSRIESIQKWWSPQIKESCKLSFQDAAEQTRAMFLDNIRLHLRSDVPLGSALSGGIDSSAVVCGIRHLEPQIPIHTFSYVAPNSPISEEAWVDRVVGHVGAIAHKVAANADDLVADIDDMIFAQGEPFGSTSIYAQYRVFRLAKEADITVTLDGQGADELLAGYHGHPGHRLLSLLSSGRFYAAKKFASGWSKWPGRRERDAWIRLGSLIIPEFLYGTGLRLVGKSTQNTWIKTEVLREAGVNLGFSRARFKHDRGRSVMAQLAQSLQERNLPALLRHADRNSMRFSIESRVPFLTTDFADFLLTLPEEYLISPSGETKSVFRAAMRGIVPDEILDRKDKIGFETPEREWLTSIAPTVRSWLSYDLNLPFLDQKVITQEAELIFAGKKPFSWQLWRWINYIRWYQQMILGHDVQRSRSAGTIGRAEYPPI